MSKKEKKTKKSAEKKQKKAKTYEPLAEPIPEVVKMQTDELLALLLDTKRSFFGNPAKKLKSELKKRLGVSEAEVFERGTLMAYSRIPDVREHVLKQLEKNRKEQEKKKEKKKQKEEAKDKAQKEKTKDKNKADQSKEVPSGETTKPPIDKSPLEAAIESTPKNKDKITLFEKSEDKEKKISLADLSGTGNQTPFSPQAFQGDKIPDSQVSARMKYIEDALDKQKEYDAKSKKKSKLRKPKNPFASIGRAFRALSKKISHTLFLVAATILSIPINAVHAVIRGVGGLLQGIYKRVGGISPFGWKKKVNQLVIYSGISKSQEELTGIVVVNASILAIIIFLLSFLLSETDIIFSAIYAAIFFVAVWGIAYAILNMMADKRADEVEAALPDVLQIVSANISAGMTPYNALWVSARKEFGALAEEIRIAQKETLGGKPFTSSLTEMSFRVRSNVLQRTIRLLIQGMKAGGELPHILQGIGADIRQMRLLQKEMAANTMSYVLFIIFGILIGAPLLFSVSIQFVDIINKFQPDFDDSLMSDMSAAPTAGGFDVMSLGGGSCPKDFDSDGIPDKQEKILGLNPKNSSDASSINPDTGVSYLESYQENAEPMPQSCVTPGYLSTFAMMALTSIAFFGSILIGLIRSGKQSAGFKLLPLILFAALAMFWIMNTGMALFFGSMFG